MTSTCWIVAAWRHLMYIGECTFLVLRSKHQSATTCKKAHSADLVTLPCTCAVSSSLLMSKALADTIVCILSPSAAVITAGSTGYREISTLWYMTPSSLVHKCERFWRTSYLHLHYRRTCLFLKVYAAGF